MSNRSHRILAWALIVAFCSVISWNIAMLLLGTATAVTIWIIAIAVSGIVLNIITLENIGD